MADQTAWMCKQISFCAGCTQQVLFAVPQLIMSNRKIPRPDSGIKPRVYVRRSTMYEKAPFC